MRAKLTIAGLLLAAVAVGFYWYSQRGMKLSETDSILIGEFSNAAGESVFDGTLREALGVSLAQSPSLNLVSIEKVREALRSMGRPVDSLLLQELAPSLCQRLGATVYLTGSIVKAGSGYSLRLGIPCKNSTCPSNGPPLRPSTHLPRSPKGAGWRARKAPSKLCPRSRRLSS